MKYIALSSSFAALIHGAASNEEQSAARQLPHSTPKLRFKSGTMKSDEQHQPALSIEDAHEILPKTAVKRDEANKNARQATLSSRGRISRYALEKQMFFIMDSSTDPVPFLREDPGEDSFQNLTYVLWFCAPSHAPDANGDGMYDSLVSHVVSWTPDADDYTHSGAADSGKEWTTQGYTASWSDEAGYYDEYVVDFDDNSVWHIKGSSFNGYEASPAGGRSGMVSAGAGEWTFDIDHPLLQDMRDAMGLEEALSWEVCGERYADVWNENNDGPDIRDE